MHLVESGLDIGLLLSAAIEGTLQGYEHIELQVYFVPPGWVVEIFDRLLEQDLDSHDFIMAEYAGEVPIRVGDGRRYRKRFHHLNRYDSETQVTFASSYYKLRPVSVILQSRRDADSEGDTALSLKLFVCDTDTRVGVKALLRQDVSVLEEGEELSLPVTASLSELASSHRG